MGKTERVGVSMTFRGSFKFGNDFWKYRFFLPDTALWFNAKGQVLLSSPEVALEITDATDKLQWMWKDRAKIVRGEEGNHCLIKVLIKRDGRWRKAALFEKKTHGI